MSQDEFTKIWKDSLRQLGVFPEQVLYCYDDGEENFVPEQIHLLAKWPNGAFTVNFKVYNDAEGVFTALDEHGNPFECEACWAVPVSDDDAYESMDSDRDPDFVFAHKVRGYRSETDE